MVAVKDGRQALLCIFQAFYVFSNLLLFGGVQWLFLVDILVDDMPIPGRGQLEHRRKLQSRRWI